MTDTDHHDAEPERRAELEALLEVSAVLHASFDLDRNLASAMRVLAHRLGTVSYTHLTLPTN